MKKIPVVFYYIKVLLLISSFYFVYIMLDNYLKTGIYGAIFLGLYLLYVFRVIYEMFTKNDSLKNDVIYNFMQIGLIVYILFVSIKCYTTKLYVTSYTFSYFRVNYIILSVLIVFILIYCLLDNTSVKKR